MPSTVFHRSACQIILKDLHQNKEHVSGSDAGNLINEKGQKISCRFSRDLTCDSFEFIVLQQSKETKWCQILLRKQFSGSYFLIWVFCDSFYWPRTKVESQFASHFVHFPSCSPLLLRKYHFNNKRIFIEVVQNINRMTPMYNNIALHGSKGRRIKKILWYC